MPQIDEEQEQLWDTVKLLSKIDEDKAKTILKATVEKTFQHIDLNSPVITSLPVSTPNSRQLTKLHEIDRNIWYSFDHQKHEKVYEHLAEYIEELSLILGDDPMNVRKKLYTSLLSQKFNKPRNNQEKLNTALGYYTTSETAEKLGLSDQTIRRLCSKGKFPGAYQTDGGHWRIPKDSFITNQEQDERAKKVFDGIDRKNKEAGNFNEFDL